MIERQFGPGGKRVKPLGLGAWPIGQKKQQNGGTIGDYGIVSRKEGKAVVERFIELGGNFIDTARLYGTSESIIGECSFINNSRDSIFIASKSHHTGAIEEIQEIEKDIEKTLRNLNTEYVDLYQIHNPPEDEELMKRVLDKFLKLKEEGKVRAIGASVKGPDVTRDTVNLAKRYADSGIIDSLQLVYSIFRRAHEETFSYAAKRGVAVIARTVMESGFLTGKYSPETQFSGHRSRWGKNRRKILLEAANRLAGSVEPPYESLSQVAIHFALEAPGVTVVIPGAHTVEQVEANWRAGELPRLSDEIRRVIDELPDSLADLANTGN